jgi:hypothetical protein
MTLETMQYISPEAIEGEQVDDPVGHLKFAKSGSHRTASGYRPST